MIIVLGVVNRPEQRDILSSFGGHAPFWMKKKEAKIVWWQVGERLHMSKSCCVVSSTINNKTHSHVQFSLLRREKREGKICILWLQAILREEPDTKCVYFCGIHFITK